VLPDMRYFLELSYKGKSYSGFQLQKNANTVQAEVQKALKILLKKDILLTGSSRTDAGVHAYQNYFHFDIEKELSPDLNYNLNAIIPADIAIKKIIKVNDDAHCRFDAVSREYKYFIYREKNPFLNETAFYFPYKLDLELMQNAATIIKNYTDFTGFSKRNTQVKTNNCQIIKSEWFMSNGCLVYNVKANRFLRGMVRSLTATMLKLGRKNLDLSQFVNIVESKNSSKASFATPPHGLFLVEVDFPVNYFD
jgi:tRNA pseudouridine38-40 synthase